LSCSYWACESRAETPLCVSIASGAIICFATHRSFDEHSNGLTRKDIKGVIESLADVGYKELKKTGAFFVPGFAKFVVIKKPATKARKGINPFTKEPTVFKAKPARKVIRARPMKAVKDAVA
jgi:DNA-binding protein HU-beta